jgi:DnaD/phage-associated family protein
MHMLDKQLVSFLERNMFTLKEIEPYLNRHRTLRDQMSQVFAACGLERPVTGADVKQLEEWTANYELPLILYAAECAHGKTLQLQYIAKLLDNWRKQEITTVEAARAQHVVGRGTPMQGAVVTTHTPTALNYQQRTYQEGELDHVFTDLSQYMEDQKNDAQ